MSITAKEMVLDLQKRNKTVVEDLIFAIVDGTHVRVLLAARLYSFR
jgi:hypothetical protein